METFLRRAERGRRAKGWIVFWRTRGNGAPTALAIFILRFPALAGWANF